MTYVDPGEERAWRDTVARREALHRRIAAEMERERFSAVAREDALAAVCEDVLGDRWVWDVHKPEGGQAYVMVGREK